MKVVVISGSPRKIANTQIMMKYVYEYAKTKNENTKLINLSEGQVECYRGPDDKYNQATVDAANDLTDADVWLVGTPIYNSFFSSALKNLFEYVDYKKTEGKVAGMAILAAGNIGFIDVQTLLTQLLSYFRIVANPKAVYLTTEAVSDNSVSDVDAQNRLKQMVDETLDMASKLRPQYLRIGFVKIKQCDRSKSMMGQEKTAECSCKCHLGGAISCPSCKRNHGDSCCHCDQSLFSQCKRFEVCKLGLE